MAKCPFSILCNTLCASNYRSMWKPLPVITKLHPETRWSKLWTPCIAQETSIHLLFECSTTLPTWEYEIDECTFVKFPPHTFWWCIWSLRFKLCILFFFPFSCLNTFNTLTWQTERRVVCSVKTHSQALMFDITTGLLHSCVTDWFYCIKMLFPARRSIW